MPLGSRPNLAAAAAIMALVAAEVAAASDVTAAASFSKLKSLPPPWLELEVKDSSEDPEELLKCLKVFLGAA